MQFLNHAQLVNKTIDKELFFSHLHPLTSGKMITKYNKGRMLKEVIINAQRFFTKMRKTKEFKRKRKRFNTESNGFRQCKRGGYNGYCPPQEQLSEAEKNRRLENQFCFNCGEPGYFSNECFNPCNA